MLLLLLSLVPKFDEVRPDICFATACTSGAVSMKAGGPLVNLADNLITLLCNDLLFASSSEKLAKIMALLGEQRRLESLERKSDSAATRVRGHTFAAYPLGVDPMGTVLIVVVGALSIILLGGGFFGTFCC